MNQIVRRRDVGKLVAFDFLLATLDVNLVVTLENLEDVHVDGYGILADDYTCLLLRLDLVVPRVISDVLDSEALGRIWIQDARYQVLGLFAEERWEFVVGVQNLLVQLLRVLVLERQVPTDHGVQDDSAGPDVCTESEVPLALDHLGSGVARTTASGLEPLAMLVEVRQTEVYELDRVIVVQQQVLWLEVTMHNTKLVNVLNSADDLLVHLGSLVLFESPVLDDVLEEFTAGAILHDEVQVVVVLNHFVQLHNLRVTNLLQDGDFTVDPLYV